MAPFLRVYRWRIAALLAAATALSYIDRQSFAVVAGEISKTIPISDVQFGRMQFLFLLSYGLMYIGGGRLMDRLGTRRGLSFCMLLWSAATALHGLITGVMGLAAARVLLGLGEGGGFPGAAKAVAEWFPKKERSLAFGIFNTGSSLGAVAAPPLIASIVLLSNWRWVFLTVGLAGMVWLAFWWRTDDPPPAAGDGVVASAPWGELLGRMDTWALIAAKFLSDSAWYFFLFWLPRYLMDARHVDIKGIGAFAWIPYAFAGAGSLLGGWFSSFLIQRGWSLDASRRISLGIAAAMLPASLFILNAPLSLAIAFFGLAMCGHQFFSTIMQTLTADMYEPAEVGTIAGLTGAAGSFGGMVSNLLIGAALTATHSYRMVFATAGLMHPAAFAVLMLFVRRIERKGRLEARYQAGESAH
jgi:MFS transporter, ACS family, hexuronate transporter